jgi:hypothetical protein
MKARGRLACLVWVAIVSLALPAVAIADDGHGGRHFFQLDVDLPQSHGYSMGISAGDRRHVELTAQRGDVAVSYSVLGRASSHRIDADFGSLGEVHIRLHLRPDLQLPIPRKKRCGESMGLFSGSFDGKVDFVGEPEVAGVVARRGRVIFFHSRHICRHAGRRPTASVLARRAQPTEDAARLSAAFSAEGRAVSFEAVRLRGGPPELPPFLNLVSAEVSEALGRVEIVRSAFLATSDRVLRVSRRGKRPETAVVALPKPLAGSASYSAAAGTPPSWRGDLSVRLPGIGTVALTGAGFSADLCRAFSTAEEDDCLRS